MTTLHVSAQTYIQSHLHQVSFFSFIYLFDLNFLIFPPQLTRQEEQSLSIDKYRKERAVRQLNIIPSLKEAYLKAMGQPIGFDFSRINCDVAKEVINEASKCIYKWCVVVLSLI